MIFPRPSCLPRPHVGTDGIVVAVVGVLFAAMVLLGAHGFSMGSWNLYVKDKLPSYSRPMIGRDRPLRVDEWCVSTPQVFAQCASPDFFPRVNSRVDGGTDMFLSTPCNPVWDWTVPGQFHNWGYFLFGVRRGLAWNWWVRFLGLPLFSYLFFLFWLGRDRLLAATAALAVSLGSPTQWWDTTMPYILLYFFSSLVFLRLLFRRGAGFAGQAAAAAGLFVSLASYAFVGYPAWEILLLPPFFALAWDMVRPGREDVRGGTDRTRARAIWFLFAALALFAAELAYYAAVHSETFRIIAGSAYPGGRMYRGETFTRFLHHIGLDVVSLCMSWSFWFGVDLSVWDVTNPCRAARYFVPMTALLALLAVQPRVRIRRVALLLGWAGILTLRGACRWPIWVAKWTGFGAFQSHRAEVVAGFIFLLVVFRTFAAGGRGVPPRWAVPITVSASLFAVLGLVIPDGAAAFFSTLTGVAFLAAGVVLTAAVSWGLATGDRRMFCGGYLAVALAGGLVVHPVSFGISPVVDKGLASLVREVDAREPGRWMADEWHVGNYLLALGVDCFPGTQLYAHWDFWKVFDPGKTRERHWNRYAHRTGGMADRPANDVAKSKEDQIRFSVSEEQLRDLGVSHLVWSGPELHEPWLRRDGRSEGLFVYTILPEGPSSGGSPPPGQQADAAAP